MMKFPIIPCVVAAFAESAVATGLTGISYFPFDPFCATSCLRAFTSLKLSCSDTTTTTECYASDSAFLTSVAYCISLKCAEFNYPASKLETFWEDNVTGQKADGVYTVPAKWSYQQSLAQVTTTPTEQLTSKDKTLNVTSLVLETSYQTQYNTLTTTEWEVTTEYQFGYEALKLGGKLTDSLQSLTMLITAFGLPILFTWLGYLPFISGALNKLNPYLIWPSLIGTYQIRPLPYLLGNAPTIGQSLYIAFFVLMNIIFTAVYYQIKTPNAWYSGQWAETIAYIFYRTGTFGYVIAPLVFLFSSRNNILLWLTNWPHSTFLLLHRWVARVFTLQALLHSILALVLYVREDTYGSNHNMPYWIWGIVATICLVSLAFASGLYVRRFFYESFLLTHIVLSVVLVVGLWYHVVDIYEYAGGYWIWVYVIAAVWGFDRVARILRIVIAGPHRAHIIDLGEEYVRVDVTGVRWGIEPGKHVYVYFPTLNPLRPWENHPFSVVPTALIGCHETHNSKSSSLDHQTSTAFDVEKHDRIMPTTRQIHDRAAPEFGLTLFVKKSQGMTKALRANANALTFLEGPYPNNSTRDVLRCDRLLLIGGGIGITSLIPFFRNHLNAKLYWSVRESSTCIVDELNRALSEIVEKEVLIGRRLNFDELLAAESSTGWGRIGVVASGPGPMCDDIRAAVVAAAKLRKTKFELEIEAYTW